MLSKSLPDFLGKPASPGRTRMWRTTTSWVAMSMPPLMKVTPGDGAVWPAMVRNGSRMARTLPPRSMIPPTSKTTIRGPFVSTASRNEPGPSAARVVTRMILPPRPPGVVAAQPWAPGKASGAAGGATAVGAESRLPNGQAARAVDATARLRPRPIRTGRNTCFTPGICFIRGSWRRMPLKMTPVSSRHNQDLETEPNRWGRTSGVTAGVRASTTPAASATAPGAIAHAFVGARLAARALPAFPGVMPATLAQAYAIQDAGLALFPDQVVGWKVGRVPPELQARLGDERVAGPTFQGSLRTPAAGETVVLGAIAGGFAAVEAEFVYRLAADAPADKTDWTA